MKLDLHQYYGVLEDSAYKSNDEIDYVEYLPSQDLAMYVQSYWVDKKRIVSEHVNTYERTMLPNGCVEIVFIKSLYDDEFYSAIGGIFQRPRFLGDRRCDERFGVRVYPWANALLFANETKEFRNQYTDLKLVNRKLFNHTKNIMELSVLNRIRLIEDYLRLTIDESKISLNMLQAMNIITRNRGCLASREVAKEMVISDRQLQRIMMKEVGLSPKSFSDIVRFQNILQTVRHSSEHHWIELANRYNFTDQSHFIRFVNKYSGVSPKKLNL